MRVADILDISHTTHETIDLELNSKVGREIRKTTLVFVQGERRARFSPQLHFAAHQHDRVFSIGVIHFWAEPIALLAEVRRVLRRGGVSLMGCLHPRTAPDFARPEYGFHLRDAAGWTELYRAAGFTEIGVETVETQQINPDGTPTTRYGFRITAGG